MVQNKSYIDFEKKTYETAPEPSSRAEVKSPFLRSPVDLKPPQGPRSPQILQKPIFEKNPKIVKNRQILIFSFFSRGSAAAAVAP